MVIAWMRCSRGPGLLALMMLVPFLAGPPAGKAAEAPAAVAYSAPAGDGRVRLPDGSVYEGPFRDGMFNGHGVLTYPAGARYEGEFRNGLFQGHGVYVSGDGDLYRGQFKRGVMTGTGEIHLANGDFYQGEIRHWQMHGTGRLRQHDGTTYEGGFVEGRFEGHGRLRRPSGDRYVGEFSKGLFHGEGALDRAKAGGRKNRLEGRWERGRYVGDEAVPTAAGSDEEAAQRRKPLNAELVLFHQYPILARSLGAMREHRPGKTDLYFLSFGADGRQDVFMKEARYTKRLFEKHFGAEGRALMLVNNRKMLTETPLASVTNLRKALQAIAKRMDTEEDILFLYLTSHGGKDSAFAVRLGGMPLRHLSGPVLADALERSGIKWRVIVISACYSGGFIEHLKDDHTLIMTSARHDHASFGCGDESDFTYFGRALFKRALPEATTFVEAFKRAREMVARWEDEQGYEHSEPQLYSTPRIEAKLADWRATLQLEVGLNKQ